MRERIIPKKEIQEMVKELEQASIGGIKTWEPVYKEYTSRKALIEMPVGELMNPKIGGYVWTWGLTKEIRLGDITETDRFKAHGLEGKASVPVNLLTAILVWKELPEFRRQIVEIKEEHLSP